MAACPEAVATAPARAVDGRQPLLQHVGGGVHEPRVDVAELPQGEQVGRVLGVAEHVAAGLVERHRPGQGLLVGSVARVEGQGVEIVVGHVMSLPVRCPTIPVKCIRSVEIVDYVGRGVKC